MKLSRYARSGPFAASKRVQSLLAPVVADPAAKQQDDDEDDEDGC